MYDGLCDTRRGLSRRDAEVVGLMTARLILSWDRWLHRRVERLTFCDEDAIHRNVSIDFTLPQWFHAIRKTPKGQRTRQLVPLGFLRKGVLVNFGLRDEHGASLPLVTSEQDAQVALAVLTVLAEGILGGDVPEPVRGDLRSLVKNSSESARQTHFDLFNTRDNAWSARATLRKDDTFANAARLFREHFLAFTILDVARSERRILHLSYDESFWNNKKLGQQLRRMWSMATGAARRLYISIPSAGESSSYHMEIEAPDGLMIAHRASYYQTADRTTTIERTPEPGGYRRAHFHFGTGLAPRGAVAAMIHLRPRRSTVIRGATLTALLAFLATAVVAIRYPHIHGGSGSTATTLLLAATGLIGLIVVRSDENEMATALLYPLRVLAVTPVVLAVGAAAVVVADLGTCAGQAVLIAISALIGLSTGLLLRNWYLVRSSLKRYSQKVELTFNDG